MSKVKETKYFEVNRNISIRCEWIKTSYGFKHEATLLDKYNNDLETAKCTYQNRTWERYEYADVLKKLADESTSLSKGQKKTVLKYIEDYDKRVDDELKPLKTVALAAMMGDILVPAADQKAKNDWKVRMLKAGLENKGLIMPEDWDELSEEEKEKRLDKVIKHLSQ